LIAGHGNFHVVPIDLTGMQYVRQGCFDYVWNCCQEFLLGRRLITDPFAYIITSVLDGDDAWHRGTVALVRDQAVAEMPEMLAAEARNFTWIRHTGGMYLSFPDGLEWYAHPDVVVPMHRPFHSMSTFVAARFSSGISACSSRHSAWPSYANVLAFKSITPEASRPMWVYVRHDRTEVPWDIPVRLSDPDSAKILHEQFGINFEKVENWRRNHLPKNGADAGGNHSGMWGTEQLDCYFRISALNRQIAVLEREAELSRLDEDGLALLARQNALRAELQHLFNIQANANFG
jgi:hypothetical protein